MPLPNTAWKPAEGRSHARLLEPCDNEAACRVATRLIVVVPMALAL